MYKKIFLLMVAILFFECFGLRAQSHGSNKNSKSRDSVEDRNESFVKGHPVYKFMSSGLDRNIAIHNDLTFQAYHTLNDLKDTTSHRDINNQEFRDWVVDKIISPETDDLLLEMLSVFMRSEYANGIVVGPAGSGKTHRIMSLAYMLSFNIVNKSLREKLNEASKANPSFGKLLKHYLGNTNVYVVNPRLLSANIIQTEPTPWANFDERRAEMIRRVFDEARRAHRELKNNGMGRRTVFVFDEMGELPPLVSSVLKTIADETGFRPNDFGVFEKPDSGFHIQGFTTPGELYKMIGGDSAIQRRFKIININEATVQESYAILKRQFAGKWIGKYGVDIEDSAIRTLLHFRKFLTSPPLAMPGSVLAAANDAILWKIQNPGDNPKMITSSDIKQFLVKKFSLTPVWFEGPNGEPPFHDLEERIGKKVKFHSEVIHKICERLKAWARYDFGNVVLVFVIDGPSGSGKDTLTRAFNEELFGHDGSHLNFNLAGAAGFGIEAIIEGPPLGNHSDDKPSRLVAAIEDYGNGIVVLNEAGDLPNEQFEKLKAFLDGGVIKPSGKDGRTRPLLFPIVLMGQFTRENTDRDISKMTPHEIDEIFKEGNGTDGKFGAIPEAILERAKATGGIYVLNPVPVNVYPEIIRLHVDNKIKDLAKSHNIILFVSDKLDQWIADFAEENELGTRSLKGLVSDLVIGAMSRANDQGLTETENLKLQINVNGGLIELTQIVENKKRTWRFEPSSLIRIQGQCQFIWE